MNKTVIFITFAVLVLLALVEALVLLIFAPQHFSTLTSFIIVLLSVASTFAATVYQLGKQKDEIVNIKEETSTKLDVVQKQTNGTLTKLIDTNHDLREENAELRAFKAQIEAQENHPPKGAVK